MYARLALACSLVLVGTLAAQPAPSDSGPALEVRVTDADDGRPIENATVLLVSTSSAQATPLAFRTRGDGRARIDVGTNESLTLRVVRTGYVAAERVVRPMTPALSPDGAHASDRRTIVVEVQLRADLRSAAAPAFTATGAVPRNELGYAVTQVDAAEVLPALPVSNMSELLAGRIAGLQVSPGAETGIGSRLRLRGQSSLLLSNQPLIVLDGMRVLSASGSGALSSGYSAPSQLDDLNPEDIERITVLRGPSATTLYGAEAANGVILLTSKRGQPGRWRLNASVEHGLLNAPHRYPLLFSGWDTSLPTPLACRLSTQVAGSCRVDSLASGNVLNDPSRSAIASGSRRQHGLQVSGGTRWVQLFLSGESEQETGVFRMPDVEQRRLEEQRGTSALPLAQQRPSALERNSARLRVTARPLSTLTLDLNAGYISGRSRFVAVGGQAYSVMLDAQRGPWRPDSTDQFGVATIGYRLYNLGDMMSVRRTQDVTRLLRSASLEYRPRQGVTVRAFLGADGLSRDEQVLQLRGEGPPGTNGSEGAIQAAASELYQRTGEVSVEGVLRPRPWLRTTTTLGYSAIRRSTTQDGVSGISLPPGVSSVDSLQLRNSFFLPSRGAAVQGFYVEQRFALADHIFLAAAIRRDAIVGRQNSHIDYPALGASWVLRRRADETQPAVVSALRLRAAYGEAGRYPWLADPARSLSAPGDAAWLQPISGLAASDRPEVTAEAEVGSDITLFGDRTDVSLTYYRRKTTNLLVGSANPAERQGVVGVGAVRNQGFELEVMQRLVGSRAVGLDMSLLLSTNRNRVVTLGPGRAAIVSGGRSTQLNVAGYPLFGLWDRRYSYTDRNADGIIAASELSLDDELSYIGPSFPTHLLMLQPTLSLLNGSLRLALTVDSQWGFRKFNNTLRQQCSGGVCRGLFDPAAPLALQAATVALGASALAGFHENGAFTRLREVSLSYEVPRHLARRVGVDRWLLALTGRNLGVRSDYSGVDPETQTGSGDSRGNEDFFSVPLMQRFSFRSSFRF